MINKAIQTFEPEQYDVTTVIGEFSGRDSVAAIIKAFEREDINYILPVATFAGTEYGDANTLYENYEKLQSEIKKRYGNRKVLYPLHEYNRSDLWHQMNGRVMTQLIEKYHFYTPCIGCHLYFHLTKIPFAKPLSKRIISGERASHDGRLKLNQLNESLETYKTILDQLGYELIMPLQNETSGEGVQKLIDWQWDEGKDHPKCVLSGNYRDAKGKALYDGDALSKFLAGYLTDMGLLVGKYFNGDFDLETLKEKGSQMI